MKASSEQPAAWWRRTLGPSTAGGSGQREQRLGRQAVRLCVPQAARDLENLGANENTKVLLLL